MTESERTERLRVVIADDQDLVRAGLRMILEAHDIDVVGEARTGTQAVALARELRPDVCLFDIRMPGLDGIEATRMLAGKGVADPLAVVVITTFDLDAYVHGALKAGARGFLLKDAGPALLVQSIHAAASGDAIIAPSITARLLESSPLFLAKLRGSRSNRSRSVRSKSSSRSQLGARTLRSHQSCTSH